MRQHFYHGTTRLYMLAFAALFDGVFCKTDGGEDTPVPLMYAQKQKFLEIVDTDYDKNITDFEMTLPRMAYELVGLNYAPERHVNPISVLSSPSSHNALYNRVPYDFSFSLYIATKQFDDMAEIYEQIVPMFTPDFSVPITEKIGDIDFDTILSVVLNSISFNVDYLGDFTDFRRMEATLNFTLKGYIYPQVNRREKIKDAIVKLADMESGELEKYFRAFVVPKSALETEPHIVKEEYNE